MRGAEVAQTVFAEAARGKRPARNLDRRARGEDLTAVGDGHHARGAVHRRTEVVTGTFLGLAGVQAHAHDQWSRRSPRRIGESGLCSLGSRERVVRGREPRVEAVTRGLHHVPVVGDDRRVDDLVVQSQRGLHRVGMLLPQACGSLDVGEQERDRSRRQLDHIDSRISSIASTAIAAISSIVIDAPWAVSC